MFSSKSPLFNFAIKFSAKSLLTTEVEENKRELFTSFSSQKFPARSFATISIIRFKSPSFGNPSEFNSKTLPPSFNNISFNFSVNSNSSSIISCPLSFNILYSCKISSIIRRSIARYSPKSNP